MAERKDFEELIKEYINTVHEIKEENYDWGILMLGRRRIGKSTTALYIAYRLHKATGRPVYLILEENIDIREVDLEPNSIVILDELGNMAFSREFAKEYNIKLVKTLNIMGAENHFYIATVQNIYWMDKLLRTTNFWEEVYLFVKRGLALWFGPPKTLMDKASAPFLFKRWSLFEDYYEFLREDTLDEFLDKFPARILKVDLRDFNKEEKFINYITPSFEIIKISYNEYELLRRGIRARERTKMFVEEIKRLMRKHILSVLKENKNEIMGVEETRLLDAIKQRLKYYYDKLNESRGKGEAIKSFEDIFREVLEELLREGEIYEPFPNYFKIAWR